jgi:crotonobetainyl-CoA:carnitine CoA-transferase CaiB-like acyl-CoA transferase
MNNAHLNAVGSFETVDSPHGPVRFPGVPTWFSRTPGRVAGADTQAVFEEFGLPAAPTAHAQSVKKDVL